MSAVVPYFALAVCLFFVIFALYQSRNFNTKIKPKS